MRRKYVVFAFSFIFMKTHAMHIARGGNMGLSTLRALQIMNKNQSKLFSTRGSVLTGRAHKRSDKTLEVGLDSILTNQSLCSILVRRYTHSASNNKYDDWLRMEQVELERRKLNLMEEDRKASKSLYLVIGFVSGFSVASLQEYLIAPLREYLKADD